MSTMEDRMSRVERTLDEMAAVNREMQEEHRAWEQRQRAWEESQRAWEERRRAWEESQRAWEDRQRSWREEDRLWLDAERAQREADRRASEEEVRQARRQWGELANKMGTLVEDIVAPGITTVFQTVFGRARIEAAIQGMRRTSATEPGRMREFDYVVVAGDLVLITETRRTLRPEDIPQFLTVLREARDYLPEYTNKQIVGALASFSVDPSLVTAGERRGLLMFGLGTGLLEVLNTPGFQPARF
jgi:hypothetical protein